MARKSALLLASAALYVGGSIATGAEKLELATDSGISIDATELWDQVISYRDWYNLSLQYEMTMEIHNDLSPESKLTGKYSLILGANSEFRQEFATSTTNGPAFDKSTFADYYHGSPSTFARGAGQFYCLNGKTGRLTLKPYGRVPGLDKTLDEDLLSITEGLRPSFPVTWHFSHFLTPPKDLNAGGYPPFWLYRDSSIDELIKPRVGYFFLKQSLTERESNLSDGLPAMKWQHV